MICGLGNVGVVRPYGGRKLSILGVNGGLLRSDRWEAGRSHPKGKT